MVLKLTVRSPSYLQDFVLTDATTLSFDFEKQIGSSSHVGNYACKFIWSWSLLFGLYPTYKVFSLTDATTLTCDFEKTKEFFFPSIMTIKCTKLYESESYGSVSILPTLGF
jgi:hypothetical protein